MGYIIGLFILLGAIFSFTGGSSNASLFSNIKDKAVAAILPASSHQIEITNAQESQKSLDTFFSSVAPLLLESKNLSTPQKIELKKAVDAFAQSKAAVSSLVNIAKEDKTVPQMIIEKVLGSTARSTLEPTAIPPQCHLECK